MDNIFENVKFGDKFITRDGRIAIYWHKDSHKYKQDKTCHNLILESEDAELICTSDGLNLGSKDNWKEDIVSRYQEPIDEETLDKLAINECFEILKGETFWYEDVECVVVSAAEDCYKAGYRKAKEWNEE